jgi:signal peptidase I
MSILKLTNDEFRDLADQLLNAGHGVRFTANGMSMYPCITDGDILDIAPLDGNRINRGDILLFVSAGERLLAHRVVNTRRQNGRLFYLLKGDCSTSPDGWFPLESILGRINVVNRRSQKIRLTSAVNKWRSKIWALISLWMPNLSWLPERLRRYVLQELLLNK